MTATNANHASSPSTTAAASAPCCGPAAAPAPSSALSGSDDDIRAAVRTLYGRTAGGEQAVLGAPGSAGDQREAAKRIGYSDEQLDGLVDGANLGLGCGNPTAIAGLNEGEVVLDLGSGAGIDAFLAAKQVGPQGRVIGVDMTPEMLERARTNAVEAGLARTVEFREGLIEQLPVADESVDVVISNCVVNLSPDKPAVFREAFRALKPGGRVCLSDILLEKPLPEAIAGHVETYAACLGGAALAGDYLGALQEAGFVELITQRRSAGVLIEAALSDPALQQFADTLPQGMLEEVQGSVFSYTIEARKP